MTITAAVDGSSLGNPGPAGWAWVISDECWDCGGWDEGTNNMGELTAVLEVLRATEAAGAADEPLHLLADSQYTINVVSSWMHKWKKRGWVKSNNKPIANLELIQNIDRALEGRTVTFEWVPGHSGHPMNERADELARGAAEEYQAGRVAEGGPGFSGATVCVGPPSIDDDGDNNEGEDAAAAVGTPDDALENEADADAAMLETPDIQAVQQEMIDAWAAGDEEKVKSFESPEVQRIWPNGRITEGFFGPVPPDMSVSDFTVVSMGEAWLVRFVLSWQGASSQEAAVWRNVEGKPLLVWHQSTIMSIM